MFSVSVVEAAKGAAEAALEAANQYADWTMDGHAVPADIAVDAAIPVLEAELMDQAPSDLLATALKLVKRAEETVVAGLDEAKINEVRNDLESVIVWLRS